jgi:hypothetical protein
MMDLLYAAGMSSSIWFCVVQKTGAFCLIVGFGLAPIFSDSFDSFF